MIRPAVTLMLVMSVDGQVDRMAHPGLNLSTPGFCARQERLRAHFDAVMVGEHGTNRRMRHVGAAGAYTGISEALRAQRSAEGRSELPLLVVTVPDATPILDSQLLRRSGSGQLWICTTEQTPRSSVAELRRAGAQVSILGSTAVDLSAALHELHHAGVDLLLVEGAVDLHDALLRAGLVDEIAVCIAPILVGRYAASTDVDSQEYSGERTLKLTVVQELDDDLLALYYTRKDRT
jgi:riboflavin biosynthesis pyrimidine reductase